MLQYWKNLKTWKKIVAVVILILMLRACFSEPVKQNEPVVNTLATQVVTTPTVEPDPSPALLIEQKDKNVIMRFECLNPNIKQSGLNIVYRNYAGELLEGSGYKTYWSIRNTNRVTGNEVWYAMEESPSAGFPKADAFLRAVWDSRNQISNEDSPVEFAFAIAKSPAEAKQSTHMTFGGGTVAYIAAAAGNNPCFKLGE